MKITLNTANVLDDILADSALGAIFIKNRSLLTPDHRQALLRYVYAGAVTVAGQIAGIIAGFDVSDDNSTIGFDFHDTILHPDALRFYLLTAVSFASLRLVANSIGDSRRENSYNRYFDSALATLKSVLTAPPRHLSIRPCCY